MLPPVVDSMRLRLNDASMKANFVIGTFLAACIGVSLVIGGEPLPGKKVVIGPDDFSEIYPAVWFCPDDATFTSLKKRSEKPPENKYRIW